MRCIHCHQPVTSCPEGDYCHHAGYVHQGAAQLHRCDLPPVDGWPLPYSAEPDWEDAFGAKPASAEAAPAPGRHAAPAAAAVLPGPVVVRAADVTQLRAWQRAYDDWMTTPAASGETTRDAWQRISALLGQAAGLISQAIGTPPPASQPPAPSTYRGDHFLDIDGNAHAKMAQLRRAADQLRATEAATAAELRADGIDPVTGATAGEPMELHSFSFEAWPPDAGETTLPGRTPRRMHASPKEAREAAQTWLAVAKGPGWRIGAGIHNRYACQPPHGGTDPIPAPADDIHADIA